jgi:hypothetical protein
MTYNSLVLPQSLVMCCSIWNTIPHELSDLPSHLFQVSAQMSPPPPRITFPDYFIYNDNLLMYNSLVSSPLYFSLYEMASYTNCVLFLLFFFLVALEIELMALCLQSRYATTWATTLVNFALVILEMGSPELFSWAGLEQWSSQSQPPK